MVKSRAIARLEHGESSISWRPYKTNRVEAVWVQIRTLVHYIHNLASLNTTAHNSHFPLCTTGLRTQQIPCLCFLNMHLQSLRRYRSHSLLLHRLASWFGVSGAALSWLHAVSLVFPRPSLLNNPVLSTLFLSYSVPIGSAP